MMLKLRQLWCGWRGHDEEMRGDGRWLRLHCLSCGHVSKGWTV